MLPTPGLVMNALSSALLALLSQRLLSWPLELALALQPTCAAAEALQLESESSLTMMPPPASKPLLLRSRTGRE